MDFKINNKTRIKLNHLNIRNIIIALGGVAIKHKEFELYTGLKLTSSRWCKDKTTIIYYYQVIDKNKYLLAKIKYGI